MVSICVSLYNKEKYIAEFLKSVLSQTYTDFECIIVDDNSTDNSLDIALSYVKKDKRIKLFVNAVNSKNKVIDALNTAFALAKGMYIIRVDADDILNRNAVETLVNFMKEHPEYDGVSGIVRPFYDDRYSVNNDCTKLVELTNKDIPDAVCNGKYYWSDNIACYKKSFIDNKNIEYTSTVLYDMIFLLNLLSNNAKLYVLDIELILHRKYHENEEHFKGLDSYRNFKDDNVQSLIAKYKSNIYSLKYKTTGIENYKESSKIFERTFKYFQNKQVKDSLTKLNNIE